MTTQTNGDDCRESGEGETSREQFEAWATSIYDTRLLKDEKGNYLGTVLQQMWEAWQASRAAIEIHLPGTFRESYQSSNMVMDAEAVKERLADAGINFKD